MSDIMSQKPKELQVYNYLDDQITMPLCVFKACIFRFRFTVFSTFTVFRFHTEAILTALAVNGKRIMHGKLKMENGSALRSKNWLVTSNFFTKQFGIRHMQQQFLPKRWPMPHYFGVC
jgi:hypothetical protein